MLLMDGDMRVFIRNNKGSMLIEMVVVLAIIAILMTLIMPKFDVVFSKTQLESVTYQMHSQLRVVQKTAIKNQCPMKVSFYLSQENTIYYIKACDEYGRWSVLETGELEQGVQLDFTQDSDVFFYDDGDMRNGHLRQFNESEQRYIYFYNTGRMRISHEAI